VHGGVGHVARGRGVRGRVLEGLVGVGLVDGDGDGLVLRSLLAGWLRRVGC
jgi:hypothetical protein